MLFKYYLHKIIAFTYILNEILFSVYFSFISLCAVVIIIIIIIVFYIYFIIICIKF